MKTIIDFGLALIWLAVGVYFFRRFAIRHKLVSLVLGLWAIGWVLVALHDSVILYVDDFAFFKALSGSIGLFSLFAIYRVEWSNK